MPDPIDGTKASTLSDADFEKALEGDGFSDKDVDPPSNGGSDDPGNGDDPPATDPPATDPPSGDDPPATDPPATDPPKEGEFKDDHDPFSTVREEDDPKDKTDPKDPPATEAPKDPADPNQETTDGQNLAKKWDEFSDQGKANKIANLVNTKRTATLESLALEVGQTVDELVSKFTESDGQANQETEDQMEARIMDKVLAKVTPTLLKQEKESFVSAVEKFGKHNKVADDLVKELVKIDSDLYKEFLDLKVDPKSGDPLTFQGRLKLALTSSPEVRMSIIQSGAMKGAKGLFKALNGKIITSGGKHVEKTDMTTMTDEEFLTNLDKLVEGEQNR